MAMEDEEFNMDKPLPVVDISMNDLFAIPGGDIILYEGCQKSPWSPPHAAGRVHTWDDSQ